MVLLLIVKAIQLKKIHLWVNKNMEKKPQKERKVILGKEENLKTKPTSGIAAETVFDKFKRQLRTSAILGMGGLSLSAVGQNMENINKKADQEFLRDNKKTEVVVDTVKMEDGKTYIKKEIYGEKITDKELQNSAASFDEIREKYINRDIRAYESVVVNSRFKKLRANEFVKSTQEESIQYGEKTVTVRLFKEGQGKELIKYLKKAYGVAEANRIIKEWGIDENSYETLLNLKRDQFVRGIVHGQDKEHSRWVYLAGGPESSGTPFIGVVTEQDIFMEGLAECSGNPVFERVSVDCEDTKVHNSNTK